MSKRRRKIRITTDGPMARLHGAPEDVLYDSLRVEDPKRFYKRAYKEGWWDGYISLHEGLQFPAGLVPRVVDSLVEQGHKVTVERLRDREPVDTSRFGKDYIEGLELWPQQYGAVMAMLTAYEGVVKSPTGSGKTEMIYCAARYLWEERGWHSLVLVPKAGLLKQTVKRFMRYANGDFAIGALGDGKEEVGPITVATAQKMMNYKPRKIKNRMRPPNKLLADVIKTFECLFLDETHHASANSWYDIALDMKSCRRRFGLSGTPIKEELLDDLRLVAATGPIIFDADAVDLIEAGLSAKPFIAMLVSDNASSEEMPYDIVEEWDKSGNRRIKRKPKPYGEAYVYGVVESDANNLAAVRAAEWLVERNRQTLILSRRKEQFRRLQELLENTGITYTALWGDDATDIREQAKHEFGKRSINVILATTIFDEGEDVPAIEGIVLAEGVSAKTNVVQRIGRGMRKDSKEVWVVDIVSTCHPTLVKHGAGRADTYEAEGYEVVVVDEWPEPDEEFDPSEPWFPFENWNEVYDSGDTYGHVPEDDED